MDFVDPLNDIVDILNKDGIILYPTDTIWGLGCHAHSQKGIEKIFEIKKRSKDQPLISLVSSIEMLKATVQQVHPRIETLLEFHNKPLTVIYPKAKKHVNELLCARKRSVAIRLVKDPFCVALIEAMGAPLVSTSANISGQPFPSSFAKVDIKISKEVDYIVKHRQEELSDMTPSVLAKYDKNGGLIFLRE